MENMTLSEMTELLTTLLDDQYEPEDCPKCMPMGCGKVRIIPMAFEDFLHHIGCKEDVVGKLFHPEWKQFIFDSWQTETPPTRPTVPMFLTCDVCGGTGVKSESKERVFLKSLLQHLPEIYPIITNKDSGH